jgi:hypothetical protein
MKSIFTAPFGFENITRICRVKPELPMLRHRKTSLSLHLTQSFQTE